MGLFRHVIKSMHYLQDNEIGKRHNLHCTAVKNEHNEKNSCWKCLCQRQSWNLIHLILSCGYCTHCRQTQSQSGWKGGKNSSVINFTAGHKKMGPSLCPITSSPVWEYVYNAMFHIDRGLCFLTVVQHTKEEVSGNSRKILWVFRMYVVESVRPLTFLTLTFKWTLL